MTVFLFWTFVSILSKSIGFPDYSTPPMGMGLGAGLERCSEVAKTMDACG